MEKVQKIISKIRSVRRKVQKRMGRAIAIANQKGGVGKTDNRNQSLSISGCKEKKVLVIDGSAGKYDKRIRTE